jgi:hypothetical protein
VVRPAHAAVPEDGMVLADGAVFEGGAAFADGAVFEGGAAFADGAVLADSPLFEAGGVFEACTVLADGSVFADGTAFGAGSVFVDGTVAGVTPATWYSRRLGISDGVAIGTRHAGGVRRGDAQGGGPIRFVARNRHLTRGVPVAAHCAPGVGFHAHSNGWEANCSRPPPRPGRLTAGIHLYLCAWVSDEVLSDVVTLAAEINAAMYIPDISWKTFSGAGCAGSGRGSGRAGLARSEPARGGRMSGRAALGSGAR